MSEQHAAARLRGGRGGVRALSSSPTRCRRTSVCIEGQERADGGEPRPSGHRETRADRVVVEYNGMWLLDVLYAGDARGAGSSIRSSCLPTPGTFLTYNGNMRQLVYDKLKSCELVVFNRFKPDMDKMEFHKVVRAASRRARHRLRVRRTARSTMTTSRIRCRST